MKGCNCADTIVSRSRGSRDGVIVRREQHRVRVVFAGTRNFDKDVGSFEIYPCLGARAVYNGGVEVVDDFDVRADGINSRQ